MKMTHPHPVKMSPLANQFAELQRTAATQGVASTQHYTGPRGPRVAARDNMGTGNYVFYNADIAGERGGTPSPLQKNTLSSFFGGQVGSQ